MESFAPDPRRLPPVEPSASERVPLLDSHAHLDLLPDVDEALARAASNGVPRVITIGVDLASSRWAVDAAASRPGVWATVGLHPHDARDWTPDLAAELEALARRPRVVGVGETGLDYHYDHSPRDVQRAVFARHVLLAHRVGLPLVVHCRNAFEDAFGFLEREGVPERGVVFHCWSGGPAEAERALRIGAVLSFSGTVTFAKADDLRAAASAVPLVRMLVETDAPFLTPVPHRGRRNEPAYVRVTANLLASVKGVAVDELAGATTAVASAVFGLGAEA